MRSSRARRSQQFIEKYSSPFFILLASRAVVALAVLFASRFVGRSAGEFPDFSYRWFRFLLRWDAGWYLKIASEGYSYNGNDLVQQPVVFYPLYPLLSRIVATIFPISAGAALLLISNLSFIGSVLIFFRIASDRHGETTAGYATAALCFFPTALFFSAGYTESLALLLIVIFFLFLDRKKYFWAAVFAGLTAATRSTGLVLLIPLLMELWRKHSRDRWQFVKLALPSVGLGTSGLWLYMLYLQLRFANAFAFTTDMRAWHVGSLRGRLWAAITLQPFAHLADVWHIGPDPNTLSPWFFVAFLALLIGFRKTLTTSAFAYSIGVLFLPYFSLAGSLGFTSFTRYIMLAFPVFMILGNQFARRAWLGLGVAGVFAALLFMYMLFFAQWYFAG